MTQSLPRHTREYIRSMPKQRGAVAVRIERSVRLAALAPSASEESEQETKDVICQVIPDQRNNYEHQVRDKQDERYPEDHPVAASPFEFIARRILIITATAHTQMNSRSQRIIQPPLTHR